MAKQRNPDQKGSSSRSTPNGTNEMAEIKKPAECRLLDRSFKLSESGPSANCRFILDSPVPPLAVEIIVAACGVCVSKDHSIRREFI